MSFIDEVRSIKTEYILNDEIKQKILTEANNDKNFLILPICDLKEHDVKALKKECFTITIEKRKKVDFRNEEYDAQYYKISW